MSAPSAGARAALAARGWTLGRAEGRLLVRRGGEPFAALEPAAAGGLTHGGGLRARPLPGARLSAADRRGLAEVAAELGLALESLRGRAPAAAPGAERHEGSEGVDLLLRTTFACNQRCAFCFVPLTGRAAPTGEVERELDALARRGAREVTISGGEPLCDPRLPALLGAARRKGFERFIIQTNAVYLSRAGLARRLAGLGATGWLVSLHSHVEPVYDRITGTRGQYRLAVGGLRRLLAEPGCDVTVNVVVNALNAGHLPELMDFIAGLRPGRRPGVYLSMINEAGHLKDPRWAVDLRRAAPLLRRAAARCRALGLPLSRCGGESSFPVCVLGGSSRLASLREYPQDRVRYGTDFAGSPLGRAKSPACRSCRHDARCLGVPAAYAAVFGVGALG